MLILDYISQLSLITFLLLSFYAASKDLIEMRIPNGVSLAIVGAWGIYALSSVTPVGSALLVAAGTLVFGFLLFTKNLLGAGDVKFMAAASLFAGSTYIAPFLLIITLSGGMLGLVTLINQKLQTNSISLKREIPYGTAILVGCCYVFLKLMHG